ncbi:MAG TPA: hypothetical protein VM370_03690, partial [Candidatus Thermoplasmatota archaeon]|nr:hypothetical protein [Candidatus Thermoplasmatota archaeon]
MLLTALCFALLGFLAFGLRAPFDARRAIMSAVGGLLVGLLAAFFNAYPGSIRGALTLLAIACILNGLVLGRPYRAGSRPLFRPLPGIGGAIIVALVALAIFPYTAWGADSVREPIYADLQSNVVSADAPALAGPQDVRLVPWDVASQLLKNGYAEDASFLSHDPLLLTRNTYPDTVKGEFLWVHAPAPETAKWLLGGRLSDKVIYVHNDAKNQVPSVVKGTLNVHLDSIWWQHRVARFAENEGEFRWILEDVALQMDDDLHPYWIGYLARLDLKSQAHMEKLLVIDAYTGEERMVDVADAPTELPWLEMVYPETYVYEWASYWGKHREGFFYRWFDANRLVTPDDVTVRYIRLDNETYWLLPMRQLNSAQLGGYVLIHTRTGETTFYDRFDDALIDYDTAVSQLTALMRSGEATKGAGSISLGISEGYLYPIKMGDGTVRDAYVFPLTEGLKISRFAVIDAHDYTTKRVFAPSIGDALTEFSALTGAGPNVTLPTPQTLRVVDGTVSAGKAIVNLNGTV